MQDIEHARRRKKKSVLSKLAESSNENSPRCLGDSLDSVGDDRTSHSDDYGLEGPHGLNNLKPSVLDSKNYSLLNVDETGLDDLNSDVDDDWHARQNLASAENAEADDLSDDKYDDIDDDNRAVRRRPESDKQLKKNDVLARMDDLRPKQSLKEPQHQQQQLALNGGHDILDAESDEDASELEEMGAAAAVAKYDKKPVPPLSLAGVPELSSRQLTDVTVPEEQPLESSSTFSSAMMKVFSFVSRSQAPSESTAMSGSVTKLSTKEARNRFDPFLFLLITVFQICSVE